LVPAFITYKVGGFVWAYIANKSAQAQIPDEKIDPKEAKRQAKQEKKQERVKYIKR